VHKLSPTFLLLALMLLPGCVADRHAPIIPLAAPPIPKRLSDGQKFLDYYPDASKRAHEQGRVVMKLQIGASGELEQPIQIDRGRTDATARLAEAAQKILSGAKFDVGDTYKKNVTASIVFELVPCGAVTQDPTTDYRINLCLDPSPYATFDFAENPPSEFEEQIHQILIHGDLADIDFLEEALGLRFRVTPPVPSPYSYGDDHGLHVLVTPTRVPKTLKVQGLYYGSLTDAAGNRSALILEFIPVECPDIALWAARSKISSTSSTDPHGNGRGTDFQWDGEHGIGVNIVYWTVGGCHMFLSQNKALGEPFSSHTESDLISPTPLVRGIGAMIAGGDIRNVSRAERALHASFTTSGPGQFGLSYELHNVIPGVDPGLFEYSVNDTGQEPSPYGFFFYVPPIPAEPKATLRLIVDIYHLCIRRGQLPSELHRRGIRFRGFVKDAEDIYVIRGRNEIRVESSMFGGCVRDIAILQMTYDRHVLRGETSKKQSAGAVLR
jgi:TonB-like protein